MLDRICWTNALRAEVLQRATAQMQLCTVAGTVIVAIIGFSLTTKSPSLAYYLLPVVAMLVLTGLRFIDRDTRAAATRVREIEREVNEIVGEGAMVWETTHGLLNHGYISRWMQVIGVRK